MAVLIENIFLLNQRNSKVNEQFFCKGLYTEKYPGVCVCVCVSEYNPFIYGHNQYTSINIFYRCVIKHPHNLLDISDLKNCLCSH
jgi:hypothetical protein